MQSVRARHQLSMLHCIIGYFVYESQCMLLWEIHILIWVFGMLLRVITGSILFWIIHMPRKIISMLPWSINVLLLNSSEIYPFAHLTLNIYHWSRRSAASLQSSLSSFHEILMSGLLTCGGGKNVPGIPGACAPAILHIWQEAHGTGEKIHCNP